MKSLFDIVSSSTSKMITNKYSTSFSLGIYCLDKEIRQPIYNIYGFVRLADEIVDSFHGYAQAELLMEFRKETLKVLDRKISLNPVLNSFQETYHKYNIDFSLVDAFLKSMEADLDKTQHNESSYNTYIYGSAEVVGLMCLNIFVKGDTNLYKALKPYAQSLGAAFQKVNFLRDIKDDYQGLGRTYFPNVSFDNFTEADKLLIEKDIKNDFDNALIGIKQLPSSSRFGVYVAYMYYKTLFSKIISVPNYKIMMERIRVPNHHKISLLFTSYVKHSFNML